MRRVREEVLKEVAVVAQAVSARAVSGTKAVERGSRTLTDFGNRLSVIPVCV